MTTERKVALLESLTLDVTGHYQRPDILELRVESG